MQGLSEKTGVAGNVIPVCFSAPACFFSGGLPCGQLAVRPVIRHVTLGRLPNIRRRLPESSEGI